MIKTTTRTIYFIPYSAKVGRKVDTDSPPTASIDTKHCILRFGRRTLQKLNMDGKFVRFFFDPDKNILGWQIQDRPMGLDEAKSWKLTKMNRSGVATFWVTGILQKFRGLTKDSYLGLEIKRYVVTNQSVIEKGQTYYYVQVQVGKDDSQDE